MTGRYLDTARTVIEGLARQTRTRRSSLAAKRSLLGIALALLAAAVLALAAAPASAVIVKLSGGKAVSYQPLRGAQSVKPFDLFFSNLDYNGGPVMPANTNYAVYWRPSGAPAYPAEYQSGVNQYLSDLAHDSGGHENTDSVSTQYNDAAGDFARYESEFGGALIDTDPYPPNGCKQATICLTDAQLTAELSKFVKAEGLPTDLAHEYFLLTPPKVEDCFEASGLECSAGSKRPVYCAYHGNVSLGAGAVLIYGNDPYDTGILGCDDGNHPNGSTSDGVIEGGLSHEHNESITDPEPNNAWTDFVTGATTGYENGDKCVESMGTTLGTASNGAKYNQVINGHFYWYQEEWSNQGHACAQRFSFSGAEPTATFTSTPSGSNEAKFNASGSTAPGGVSRYSWQWGDRSEPAETTTSTTTHKFPTKGPFVVALTVFAADGTSIGTARTIESGSVVPAPTVLTEAASAVTKTGASLHGSVNPNGRTVSECRLEYGSKISYGKSTSCTPLPGSGSSPVAVSAAVSGLTPNTTYHFRVVATNGGGTRTGVDQTLKTLPNAPTVKTEAASALGPTSVTLNATANPNGGNVTECKLEYGITTAYGSSATCSPAPGSGESPVAVSAAVGGLSANTTYHFRISATNAGGTSKGADETFKTLAPAPTVTTTAATAVTRTLASLNGTVNPNGSTVSDCHFEYGSTTSYGSTTPCASLPGSGESAVAVEASAGNLSPSATYHFRVSATNAAGTSTGADQSFTTLAALPSPHWYKNGAKLALGEKSQLIGWGTLTLESSAATATCHSAEAANVENSAGAATKEVLLFATYECKPLAGNCTGGEARATPRHLPWNGTLLEEGVEGSEEFREEGSGIELSLECFKGGINTASELFRTGPVLAEVGTSTPAWQNGTSATKPAEAGFDASSGHLLAEVEKAAVKGTTKGKLKFVGYLDNAPVPLITLAKP
jgi:hypothetical protein